MAGGYLDPVSKTALNQNPQDAFNYAFGDQAGGVTPFSNWLRNQGSRYYGAYSKQLTGDNPNKFYSDFLNGENPEDEWNNLAPQQRGENPSQYSNRVRMTGSIFT